MVPMEDPRTCVPERSDQAVTSDLSDGVRSVRCGNRVACVVRWRTLAVALMTPRISVLHCDVPRAGRMEKCGFLFTVISSSSYILATSSF